MHTNAREANAEKASRAFCIVFIESPLFFFGLFSCEGGRCKNETKLFDILQFRFQFLKGIDGETGRRNRQPAARFQICG